MLVMHAMNFAIKKHGDQKRKYTNTPYWLHPAEVAGIVGTVPGVTVEMIAASWLHDVVEDTDTSLVEIHSLFGSDVCRLVRGLTDVSRPEHGSRAIRKAMDRDHLAGGCWKIQTIKMADIISNTACIMACDEPFARVYIPEKRALLDALTLAHPTLRRLAASQVGLNPANYGSVLELLFPADLQE